MHHAINNLVFLINQIPPKTCKTLAHLQKPQLFQLICSFSPVAVSYLFYPRHLPNNYQISIPKMNSTATSVCLRVLSLVHTPVLLRANNHDWVSRKLFDTIRNMQKRLESTTWIVSFVHFRCDTTRVDNVQL